MIDPGEKKNHLIDPIEEELLEDEEYIKVLIVAFDDNFLSADEYEDIDEEDQILRE